MKYNFDEIIDRTNTNCEKYDSRERIFGKSDVIPLWVADTDFRTPDFIVKAVKERASHEVYGYPQKPESFFEAIQGWVNSRHNWDIERDWIMYSPNVVIGLASLVLSLSKPGDKIIVQPPVYFPFFHVIEGNERVIIENELVNDRGRYRFDFEDLKSKIDEKTKMLFLCNPHNPGGMVWSREELTELGKICIEKGVTIVSDEIHSDLVFSGNRHTPFASISDEFAQNSITAMAASKTFNIAGLSASYLIMPNSEHRRAYQRFMYATHISSGNFFGLVATEAAYRNGADWLQQLMAYLEGNLEFVSEYLEKNIPGLKLMKPEGTYLLWIDASELPLPTQKVYQLLVDGGVGLSPGRLFGSGGENYLRLNMGCPRSVLHEALNKMKTVIDSL